MAILVMTCFGRKLNVNVDREGRKLWYEVWSLVRETGRDDARNIALPREPLLAFYELIHGKLALSCMDA
jgi:hypothetical protein